MQRLDSRLQCLRFPLHSRTLCLPHRDVNAGEPDGFQRLFPHVRADILQRVCDTLLHTLPDCLLVIAHRLRGWRDLDSQIRLGIMRFNRTKPVIKPERWQGGIGSPDLRQATGFMSQVVRGNTVMHHAEPLTAAHPVRFQAGISIFLCRVSLEGKWVRGVEEICDRNGNFRSNTGNRPGPAQDRDAGTPVERPILDS